MKILIVEDKRRVGRFLRKLSPSCIMVRGRVCAAARDALAESPYDVVVLDLGLPDGDGLDLLREWRRTGVETPVLIVSARDAVEDRIKGLNLGADDYLPKPFSVENDRAGALAPAAPIGEQDNPPHPRSVQLDLCRTRC